MLSDIAFAKEIDYHLLLVIIKSNISQTIIQ